MGEIAERIDAVIAARRTLLPEISAEIELWHRADQAVTALATAVEELRTQRATPPEVVAELGTLRITDAHAEIATVVEQLKRVQARVGRPTVNIGVSGNARVGKSSLLQSISGLGEQELPTGSGLPVTAVRSRIHHAAGMPRAVLELHTFATFRASYLQPRHNELGFPEAPTTVAEFAAWAYPAPGDQSYTNARFPTLLDDLREAHAALPHYADLLERGSRSLELTGDQLAGLRDYVAYPTLDQKQAGSSARRYLAVRDIRIECPFPVADVGSIGVCDLPGIGEISVDADRHHIVGLQHEVDVVVLVKRAAEGMSYWGDTDAKAIELLDEARGFVTQRKDFVFVLLNIGAATPVLVDSLRDDVRRRLNEGRDGLHYRVLEADVRSGEDVAERVLRPVLRHLADRLPTMDADILDATRAGADAVRDRLFVVARDCASVLRQVRGLTAGTPDEVYRRADELQKSLAVALHTLLAELRTRATGRDPSYVAAVETAYRDALEWVRAGLGVGRDTWCADALRTMIRDHGSGRFATNEFNRVRVELSQKFAALDLFFQAKVRELWAEVAAGLTTELPHLLGDLTGAPALTRLADLAGGAVPECSVMHAALAELLELRLDYRTQVYPRVRPELDGLNLQVAGSESGEYAFQAVVPTSEDGAAELYQIVCELAEQAAYRIRRALLDDAALPGQVLFAAVEQFDDQLIRSGAADREIRQLARSYRDEIWPGVFEGLDEADARVARVLRTAGELTETTEHLGRR